MRINNNKATKFEADPDVEPLAEWEKELLGVTPRKIEFTDIQQGDLIKVEYTKNGVKKTLEGVAYQKGGTSIPFWHTEARGLLADTGWTRASYTLLERPEPPKPNPFEVAGVGSLAAVGASRYLKKADGKWYALGTDGTLVFWGHTDEAMFESIESKVTYSA